MKLRKENTRRVRRWRRVAPAHANLAPGALRDCHFAQNACQGSRHVFSLLPSKTSRCGIMDSYLKLISAFFARLIYGPGLGQPPAVQLSKSLGSPLPQTSPSTSPCISLRIECSSVPSRFRSFRTSRRAYPVHSLLHLSRPASHRLLCTILHSISSGDQRLPAAAGGVFTTVEHDVQGYAVTIATMDMGMPRGAPTTWLEFRGGICTQVQHHRERVARGRVSGYQREVLPCSPLALDRR